jgi:hypothetical protein
MGDRVADALEPNKRDEGTVEDDRRVFERRLWAGGAGPAIRREPQVRLQVDRPLRAVRSGGIAGAIQRTASPSQRYGVASGRAYPAAQGALATLGRAKASGKAAARVCSASLQRARILRRARSATSCAGMGCPIRSSDARMPAQCPAVSRWGMHVHPTRCGAWTSRDGSARAMAASAVH